MSLRRIAPRVGAGLLLLAGPVAGAVTARLDAAVPEPAPPTVVSAPAAEATEVAAGPEAPENAGGADDGRTDDGSAPDTRRRAGVEDTADGGDNDARDGRNDGAPDRSTRLGRGTAPGDTAIPPPAVAAEDDSDGPEPSVPPEAVERLLEGGPLTETDRLILERLEERNRLTLLFPGRL